MKKFNKMDLKSIARKKAKECGHLQELQMLEKIYYQGGDYSEFLELMRVNSEFYLQEVEVLESFVSFFDKNSAFFIKWLEKQAKQDGDISVLSFLGESFAISLNDFLESTKEIKEIIVQGFIHSSSVALYQYFYENEVLTEPLDFCYFKGA